MVAFTIWKLPVLIGSIQMLNCYSVVQRQPGISRYFHRIPGIHQGSFDRGMRQTQRVAKFMNGHGKNTGTIFGHCSLVRGPYFIGVEMDVATATAAGKESVGQNCAVAIEWIPVIMGATVEKY